MQKNGSRLISYKQYRVTDLFLFAVILIAFELIVHYAFIAYSGEFTFSPMLAIVLLVMMRWGWQSAFYAAGDGILFCLLNMSTEGFNSNYFAIYAIGNLFIMFLLIATKFIGKERLTKHWYTTLIFILCAWLLVVLGRAVVAVCFGYNFSTVFMSNFSDFMSLAITIILIMIFRRLDGMFVDQKSYLLKIADEKKQLAKRDEFGDEEIQLDEETVNVLKRDNDIY
jgi:hypothetical protein